MARTRDEWAVVFFRLAGRPVRLMIEHSKLYEVPPPDYITAFRPPGDDTRHFGGRG